jgi:hypothetical protein
VKPGITVSACCSALSRKAVISAVSAAVGARPVPLDPEAEIERHLVVARACGVQPPGGRADQFGKPRLDVHVDVFELAREDESGPFRSLTGSCSVRE